MWSPSGPSDWLRADRSTDLRNPSKFIKLLLDSYLYRGNCAYVVLNILRPFPFVGMNLCSLFRVHVRELLVKLHKLVVEGLQLVRILFNWRGCVVSLLHFIHRVKAGKVLW